MQEPMHFPFALQLSAEVMKRLEDYKLKGQRVEAYTFEIYTAFQHLTELSEHIEEE